MIERELGRIKRIVTRGRTDIDVMDLVMEEERMHESRRLRQSIDKLFKKVEEIGVLVSPKKESLKIQDPYQYATIQANESGRVYFQDVPKGWVAVITRMANTWFPNTYYVVSIDNVVRERRLERAIAALDDPIEVKHFVKREVQWNAYNNDTNAHVFEVLCDGYLIDEEMYERMVS